jgi:hypothetical protein
LIDETIRSLKLLFPRGKKDTLKWYRKISYSKELDPTLIECGQLRPDERQVENFKFWHDRLVVLKQYYDESRPSTLPEWWYDQRNGVQWYTFWVAAMVLLLTIVFGVIQCIEGAFQVYKAYNPSPS